MLTKAKVLSIHYDYIELGCLDMQGCKNCSAFFCSGKKGRESSFSALNPQGFDLEVEDLVIVELSAGVSILTSLILFALPLFCGLLIFLIASYFFHLPALLNALFSLAAIGGGLVLACLVFRLRGRKDYPKIVNFESSSSINSRDN